jgi:hypothetical protein
MLQGPTMALSHLSVIVHGISIPRMLCGHTGRQPQDELGRDIRDELVLLLSQLY